jgi:hypothetical protein
MQQGSTQFIEPVSPTTSTTGGYFRALSLALALSAVMLFAQKAAADPFFFSTGNVDGLIGTASRPESPGKIETESADDFIITNPTTINQATFTGLLPTGFSVNDVGIEIYRVFPKDSANPPSGNVPTRVNSPSDVAFQERDLTTGLTFTTQILSSNFTVANSVVNGINKIPNQHTDGEGPVTGQEVLFTVSLSQLLVLSPDHYFFIPQVQLATGDFLWLSAPKPIVGPGTPFSPDLQSWIRNANLAPDWLRIGTDIVGGTTPPTYNAAFSLTGTTAVPEPASMTLVGLGMAAVGLLRRRFK